MASDYSTAAEAANRLGISRQTFYQWLAQSDIGEFEIRGQPFSVKYYQSGRRGHGRITIDTQEIERLREAMRVPPQPRPSTRSPVQQRQFPGITVALGRPNCMD